MVQNRTQTKFHCEINNTASLEILFSTLFLFLSDLITKFTGGISSILL